MPDRRPPYARTLAVLRVLYWPLRYPPLNKLTPALDWLTRTPVRFAATVAVCVVGIAWTIVIKVVIYRG